MREEMAANHQTISITVSGLAELAHSEYQVRARTCKVNDGWTMAGWLFNLVVFRPVTMRMPRSTACSYGGR